jgi:hypothetical protein
VWTKTRLSAREEREREREYKTGPRKDVRRSSGWKKKEDEELR